MHCKKNNEKTEIKPAFQLEFPHLCVPELDLSHWTGVVPFVQLLSRILAKHLLRLNDKLNGDQLKSWNLVGPLQYDALDVILQKGIHLILIM